MRKILYGGALIKDEWIETMAEWVTAANKNMNWVLNENKKRKEEIEKILQYGTDADKEKKRKSLIKMN